MNLVKSVPSKWERFPQFEIVRVYLHQMLFHSSVQAQYWHDPLHEDGYRELNIFMADLNQENVRNNHSHLFTINLIYQLLTIFMHLVCLQFTLRIVFKFFNCWDWVELISSIHADVLHFLDFTLLKHLYYHVSTNLYALM